MDYGIYTGRFIVFTGIVWGLHRLDPTDCMESRGIVLGIYTKVGSKGLYVVYIHRDSNGDIYTGRIIEMGFYEIYTSKNKGIEWNVHM